MKHRGSVVVNGPLSLSKAYRECMNLPLLAVVLALLALALVLALLLRKGRSRWGEAEGEVRGLRRK